MNAEPRMPTARTDIATGTPPALMTRVQEELDEPVPNIRDEGSRAMEVFFAWEKLRLIYNGVLVVIAVVVCGPPVVLMIGEAILGAIAANLMFCAGPVGECYLAWWGVPRLAARWVLFVLGMVVSAGITMNAAADAVRNLPQWH